MADKKLTAKKVLTIVVCSALGSAAIILLYLGIFVFPRASFSRSTIFATVSLILSLSAIGPIVVFVGGMKKRLRKAVLLAALTLVLVVPMVSAIGVVWIDIWKTKAELDNLYWIAENTHSGMVGFVIEEVESMLHQRVTLLAGLTFLTVSTILVMSLLILKHRQTGGRIKLALREGQKENKRMELRHGKD